MVQSGPTPSDSDLPRFFKYGSIDEVTEGQLELLLSNGAVNIFEKLDGGNCQVRRANYQLYPATRSRFLRGQIINSREWFSHFVQWTYSNNSLYNLPEDVILFGEWMGNHTIDYDPQHTNRFHLIDIYRPENGRFMPYDEAIDLLKVNDVKEISNLRILESGVVSPERVKELLYERSDYYDGPREGLVIKNYEGQEFFKILHPDFEEKRERAFGMKEKYKAQPCLTPMRVLKAGFRLGDDGQFPINMQQLAVEVDTDIHKETGKRYGLQIISSFIRDCSAMGKLKKLDSYLRIE